MLMLPCIFLLLQPRQNNDAGMGKRERASVRRANTAEAARATGVDAVLSRSLSNTSIESSSIRRDKIVGINSLIRIQRKWERAPGRENGSRRNSTANILLRCECMGGIEDKLTG